jgi:hypothetical protein
MCSQRFCLRMETLVVVGQHSPYVHTTKKMVDSMDKLHTTLLVMDDIADVLFLAVRSAVSDLDFGTLVLFFVVN